MINLKYDQDRTDVILASWKNVALPAILYGIETVIVSADTLRELEVCQNTIGRFALQVRGSTATELINIDLGLKPVKMVIYERKLSYYYKIVDKNYKGSDYVKICMNLHTDLRKVSTYLSEINSIKKEIGIVQDDASYVAKIDDWGRSIVKKGMVTKSTLKSCSLPKVWWKKATYVNDSEYSKIISEFRGGNAMLGNRDNQFIMFAPTTQDLSLIHI